MRRLTLTLFALLVAVVAQPRHASAQCNAACTTIFLRDGSVAGFGCVTSNGSGTTCLATSDHCTATQCKNALLWDRNGVLLATAKICSDKVTVAPLEAASARRAEATDPTRQPPDDVALVASALDTPPPTGT